ncbi:MAG: hypothetical protein ACPHQP_11755, partial [Longimicrobiales bacterium]
MRWRWIRRVGAITWLVAGVPSSVAGQQLTLTPDAYGQWERLGAFHLDPTGTWVVTAVARVDGEAELRLARANGEGEGLVLAHGRAPEFTADGRWLMYRKGVSAAEAEAS